MQHLEGSSTPFLYIGRTVLKGYVMDFCNQNGECLLRDTDWEFIYNSG
jgi:hypothetical protein